MFLNVTNHPSELWPPAQTAAALQYGEIRDLPFPAVPPEWDIRKVAALADTLADDILRLRPAAVLCQGEMTLTYQLVNRLHAAGIPALCACTERRTEETRLPTGETKKISVFEFRGFRRYA
mgnify:CR=1 FL=1